MRQSDNRGHCERGLSLVVRTLSSTLQILDSTFYGSEF
uniref:Uncharacterized protein n=1 Tax=Arundo donax TaxID=35708 RepID=A0A0A9EHM2_ARUDO